MPRRPPKTSDPWLDAEIARCAADPDRFNSVVIGRTYQDGATTRPADFWSKQREICRSVLSHRITAAPSGNGVGKSFLGGALACWFTASHPGSKAVVSAPTQGQLRKVLWTEVEQAYRSAASHGLPLGGRLRALEWDLDDGWRLEGFGSGSTESKSGRHAADLLAIVDEASGVPASVMEAIDSLNPSKILYLGNPLRPEGKFYEVCERSADNPQINVVRVPSLESPDIHRQRSPRGMADAGWLETCRHEYGEDSIWWQSHVLALFPGSLVAALLEIAWLELAAKTVHVPAGDRWLGIDLGEGGGGDPTVLVVRDSNGILAHRASNRWDLDAAAEQARDLSDRLDINPSHIVYDQTGIGADFDNRLRPLGLIGAKGFKGSREGGDKFFKLRAACGWAVRQRLDPKRMVRKPLPNGNGKLGPWVPQHPFSLPPELLAMYRAELQGCRYQNTPAGEIALETKEDFVKRLKHSPNFLDAWLMTYAYPYA